MKQVHRDVALTKAIMEAARSARNAMPDGEKKDAINRMSALDGEELVNNTLRDFEGLNQISEFTIEYIHEVQPEIAMRIANTVRESRQKGLNDINALIEKLNGKGSDDRGRMSSTSEESGENAGCDDKGATATGKGSASAPVSDGVQDSAA